MIQKEPHDRSAQFDLQWKVKGKAGPHPAFICLFNTMQ
jgi:hypothetical protein